MPGFYDEPAPEPVKPPEKTNQLYYILGGAGALLIAINIAAFVLFRPKLDISKFDKDFLILTVAEMVVNSSPGYEVVECDKKTYSMKIKDTKTEKTVAFDSEDLKNSKFVFVNKYYEEVKINFEDRNSPGLEKSDPAAHRNIPEGIIVYPRVAIKTNSKSDTPAGEVGELEQHTSDSIEKVVDVLVRELKSAGYSITVSSVYPDSGAIIAEHEETLRVIAVDVLPDATSTKIIIHYTFKTL